MLISLLFVFVYLPARYIPRRFCPNFGITSFALAAWRLQLLECQSARAFVDDNFMLFFSMSSLLSL